VSEVSVSDGGGPAVHSLLRVETAHRDDASPLVPDANCSVWVGKVASITLQERLPPDLLPRKGSTVQVLTEAVVASSERGEVMLRSFRLLARLDQADPRSSSNVKLRQADPVTSDHRGQAACTDRLLSRFSQGAPVAELWQ